MADVVKLISEKKFGGMKKHEREISVSILLDSINDGVKSLLEDHDKHTPELCRQIIAELGKNKALGELWAKRLFWAIAGGSAAIVITESRPGDLEVLGPVSSKQSTNPPQIRDHG